MKGLKNSLLQNIIVFLEYDVYVECFVTTGPKITRKADNTSKTKSYEYTRSHNF